MKISWNHLQSYFSEPLDKKMVLERMTMAGLEVEDETPVAPDFSGIVVGQVVNCEKHPDADRLSLCKVDIGHGKPLQIVCAATNVAAGVKVPCAMIGAVLPDDFEISERKMRGFTSFGMLCSGNEIGCPDGVDGLLLLPEDAIVGQDIRDYLDLNDSIIEFKITPNRGDCLSYLGLAREISALTNYHLKDNPREKNYLIKESTHLSLKVSAPELCPHYIGLTIKNVNNQNKTPNWLVRILERSGIRSISAVVDITNYVLISLGQPMHAFDLSTLACGIHVRMAKDGETLRLIDSSDAKLSANSLLIANSDDEPLAIAGVMGGLDSGVNKETTQLMLESAFFVPDAIHGKTRQYGVNSDAAFRYERGVDPKLQERAINLAAKLIVEICGGVVDEYVRFESNKLVNNNPIGLSFSQINTLIGEDISKEECIAILNKLGCQVELDSNQDGILVIASGYRFDLRIKEDLVEEIIRVYGYDRINAKMPVLSYTMDSLSPHLAKLNMLKETMLGYGFNEIISYAFIDEEYARNLSDPHREFIRLKNPIAGLNVMRNNLIPGLIKSLQYNINRGYSSAKLFELARVFHSEKVCEQPLYLSGLIYGKVYSLNWANDNRAVDFFDLRVIIEEFLSKFGNLKLSKTDTINFCHPGRSAQVYVNDILLGFIGQLHPKFSQELDIDNLPYVFEINIEKLGNILEPNPRPSSKYQKVSRDIAFLLKNDVSVGEILDHIRQLNVADLFDLNVFDVFQGGNLTPDQKSVAFNFIFQADKTLGDDEINTKLDLIKDAVICKFGAQLR